MLVRAAHSYERSLDSHPRQDDQQGDERTDADHTDAGGDRHRDGREERPAGQIDDKRPPPRDPC